MQLIAVLLDQPAVAIGKLRGCFVAKSGSGDETTVGAVLRANSAGSSLNTHMLECFQMP